MSNWAKAFIGLITVSGTAVLAHALVHWQPPQFSEWLALLVISVVASRLRVKLPGLTGTMSVNLPFILVAIGTLSASESMIVGCVSSLTQSLPASRKRFNKVQAIFNVSNMALAIAATRAIYGSMSPASANSSCLSLVVATAGFFIVNSMPVAIIISLTEHSHPARTWAEMFQLSFPYYVASAGIAGAALSMSGHIAWWHPVVILILVLGILHSYRRYFSRSVLAVESKAAVSQLR